MKISFLPFNLNLMSHGRPFDHHCMQVNIQEFDCLVERTYDESG